MDWPPLERTLVCLLINCIQIFLLSESIWQVVTQTKGTTDRGQYSSSVWPKVTKTRVLPLKISDEKVYKENEVKIDKLSPYLYKINWHLFHMHVVFFEKKFLNLSVCVNNSEWKKAYKCSWDSQGKRTIWTFFLGRIWIEITNHSIYRAIFGHPK